MKSSRLLRSLASAFVGFSLLALPLAAQIAGTGAIAGVVRDPSGALVLSGIRNLTNSPGVADCRA